jgi:hypothetical protein
MAVAQRRPGSARGRRCRVHRAIARRARADRHVGASLSRPTGGQ